MPIIPESATELGRALQNGLQVSEVAEHFRAAIAARNPELHAFVSTFAGTSPSVAKGCSPLWGVPVGIKDLNAVGGASMRLGSRACRGLIAPCDDLIVRRLRQAGLVFMGKTSTSEFGLLPITEPQLHPPTRNPHDLRFSAGGSSGGSAAAVASGMVPVALGSDGAGSIRIPASFCGICGLKPSAGLLPNPFLLDDETLIWSCGPMAKTVDDVFALLACMLGPHVSSWDRLVGNIARLRSKQPRLNESKPLSWIDTAPKRWRIRWTARSELFDVEPAISQAVENAARQLGELGHAIEPMPPLGVTTPQEFLPVWQRNSHTTPLVDLTQVEPFTRWLRAAKCDRAVAGRLVLELRRRFLTYLGSADFWLTPTVPCQPPRIGEWKGLAPPELYAAASRLAVFTAPFNITGQPAISIPAGRDADGLPMGVQLIGKGGADLDLLRLAKQLEGSNLNQVSVR